MKLPWVNNLIDCLGEATYITTQDLTWGYWQLAVANSWKSMMTLQLPSQHPWDLFSLGGCCSASVEPLQPFRGCGLSCLCTGWFLNCLHWWLDLVIFTGSWEEC